MRPLSRNACLVYETSQDDRILRIAHLGGGGRPDASVAFLAGPPNDLGCQTAGPHSLAARKPSKIQTRARDQRPKLPKHEAAPVAATCGKRTTLGKLDTFVGLTVPAMCPLACRAAFGLACAPQVQGGPQRRGPSDAITSLRFAWPLPPPPHSSGDAASP